jgi:hypothetical protein
VFISKLSTVADEDHMVEGGFGHGEVLERCDLERDG